ncbi:MAG: MCE family protein [Nevskiaceae bacterium]|nr:MAG: MCE family protein [Nevskiaceae bacterium]
MNDDAPPAPDAVPPPQVRTPRRGALSLIWLVPLIAALAGMGLAIRSLLNAGPSIEITFESAEGIEAEKTEVRFKDVVIGKVRRIDLSEDRSHVVVKVDLAKSASGIAVDDTRFWIERPRIGLGGVSGISTLLSGAYIGVDAGTSDDSRKSFVGLEKPPALTHDQRGRSFLLHTADAGSLSVGSPLYYRRIAVGRVLSYDLDKDGRNVTLQVFVNSPYDRFVTTDARFWNASGVDLSLNAAGLKLNTQSLATVFAGGIAFQPLSEEHPGAPAPENADFTLFGDQASSLAPPDGPPEAVVMNFESSTRGLTPGSPVDFRGVSLGVVRAIELNFDPAAQTFYSTVSADLYPDRLGPARQAMLAEEKKEGISHATMIGRLVERGLRAQMRTGNLLTGQMYVALDLLPNVKRASFDPAATPLVIPTAPGSLEEMQSQILSIVRKLDSIPYDRISKNLDNTLQSADSLLQQLDHDLGPQARKMLENAQRTLQSLNENLAAPDAPLQQNLGRTLEQVNATSRSLRTLADYLEKHPESLIRGKPDAVEPGADAGKGTPP